MIDEKKCMDSTLTHCSLSKSETRGWHNLPTFRQTWLGHCIDDENLLLEETNVEAYYAASNVTSRNRDLVFLILSYFSQKKNLFDNAGEHVKSLSSVV